MNRKAGVLIRISQRYKKTVSLLLVIVMIATLFLSATGITGAATGALSYSFSRAERGYAEGNITLSAGAGTYWLYWADDTGALDGFYPIATLTVSSSAKTHTMPAQTAIPAGATKVIALQSTAEPSNKSVSNAAAVYTIPDSKRLTQAPEQRRYRFLSYGDVHFDATYRTYKYDEVHWRHALQTAADRGVDFMVGSGDYTENKIDFAEPWVDEWHRYQKILAESDYCNPIYEAIGNHELWHDASEGTRIFARETGLEGSNGNASKAYFEKTIFGDHFLFMAMENDFNPQNASEFSDAQLNWLQGLLERYSGDGHNIYIIEHSNFENFGAGDRLSSPYYDIPLSDRYSSTTRLKSLLNQYKDAIFISGHTHISFKDQFNYSNNNGASAQQMHNSSVGGIRKVSNGTLDRDYQEDETEAYIVDVFDDAVLFHGTNLYYNRMDPNCCYLLKTSRQMLSNPDPVVQPTTAKPSATATSYYLKGSFNGWGTGNPFYTTSDSNVISASLYLSAGTYTFKINNGSTWYGNSGTIEDTTKKTSNGGWEMTTSAGNCTLKATGGTYTFNFILSSKKLNVLYAAKGASSVGAGKGGEAVGAGKTYYLFGYINGADYGDKADYANMGIYKFVNGKLTATFSQESYVGVKESGNAAWYMTNGYAGKVNSVKLINTDNLGDDADKLYIPAGKINFTLSENTDGSLTLSYAKDEPTTAAPATQTAPATQPAVVTITYGDVNGDGKVDVCDATAIQRHVAAFQQLTGTALQAADVTGDGGVTIADAAAIQKFAAHLITQFSGQTPTEPATQPSTQPTQPATQSSGDGMTAAQKSQAIDTAQANLTKFYRYASYDCYQALKKECRAAAELRVTGKIAQVNGSLLQELTAALLNVADPANVDSGSTTRKVYFENSESWGAVHAYVWGNNGAGSETDWPGNLARKEGYNEMGRAVYSYTITNPNFKNIVFNNGGQAKTADIRVYRDSLGYYISDTSSLPYYVKNYIFKPEYIKGNTA